MLDSEGRHEESDRHAGDDERDCSSIVCAAVETQSAIGVGMRREVAEVSTLARRCRRINTGEQCQWVKTERLKSLTQWSIEVVLNIHKIYLKYYY